MKTTVPARFILDIRPCTTSGSFIVDVDPSSSRVDVDAILWQSNRLCHSPKCLDFDDPASPKYNESVLALLLRSEKCGEDGVDGHFSGDGSLLLSSQQESESSSSSSHFITTKLETS